MRDLEHVKSAEVVPRFFASHERQLFGVYHAPQGAVLRKEGVVLCYPGPQEYAQVHWAFQKLARLLSLAGLHVLRFDYSATGDSFGESVDGSLDMWTDDIGAAVAELRDLAGVRRIAIVGMRLGATLAMRAIAEGVRASRLVLWDPIVSGEDYVRALDRAEDTRLGMLYFPEPNVRVPGEVMGYPFPDEVRNATSRINLLEEPIGEIERVMLVGTNFTDPQLRFQHRLEAEGVVVTTARRDDPALYAEGRHPRDTILSHNIPVAITDYLSGRLS